MIVRIVIALFTSLVSGVCYMAGMTRLMSALLIGFGVLSAVFFGVVFLLPADSARVSFALGVEGVSWPFFALALILVLLIGYLYLHKPVPGQFAWEPLGSVHLKWLGGGVLLYLAGLFVPVLLWFPSEEALAGGVPSGLGTMMLAGVAIFIAGISAGLYLIYRATRGGTGDNPELMRRLVPTLFSVFHLDKVPALAAYLLTYSSPPPLVSAEIAALALAAYIPVAWFLISISASMERDKQ